MQLSRRRGESCWHLRDFGELAKRFKVVDFSSRYPAVKRLLSLRPDPGEPSLGPSPQNLRSRVELKEAAKAFITNHTCHATSPMRLCVGDLHCDRKPPRPALHNDPPMLLQGWWAAISSSPSAVLIDVGICNSLEVHNTRFILV
jgi:hypothetical protein